MAKKKKFYVVWKGRKPGIYSNWNECKEQVFGFEGAKYKAFSSKIEAENVYKNPSLYAPPKTKSAKSILTNNSRKNIIQNSLSVDAACSGNPGIMEYQGVQTNTKKRIFHFGPVKDGTNNIGEFLAIIHGLAYLKKNNLNNIPIYTDSKTALAWVRNKKVKTTLQPTKNNKILFDLIDRGIKWLKENEFSNPLLKWDTKSWGEIPADFGRK